MSAQLKTLSQSDLIWGIDWIGIKKRDIYSSSEATLLPWQPWRCNPCLSLRKDLLFSRLQCQPSWLPWPAALSCGHWASGLLGQPQPVTKCSRVVTAWPLLDNVLTKVNVLVAQSCPTLCVSCSVMSTSFAIPWTVTLLCPWNSPGWDTGVGSHSFFQGIFLTQGSNLCLILYCRRQILYCLSQQGNPKVRIELLCLTIILRNFPLDWVSFSVACATLWGFSCSVLFSCTGVRAAQGRETVISRWGFPPSFPPWCQA